MYWEDAFERIINATQPVTIRLREQSLEGKPAIALAEALKKVTQPVSLDLSANPFQSLIDIFPIGVEGAIALAKVIEQTKQPVSLNLTGQEIEDAGAIALANALKKATQPVSLNITNNWISTKGINAFIEYIKSNDFIFGTKIIYSNDLSFFPEMSFNFVEFNILCEKRNSYEQIRNAAITLWQPRVKNNEKSEKESSSNNKTYLPQIPEELIAKIATFLVIPKTLTTDQARKVVYKVIKNVEKVKKVGQKKIPPSKKPFSSY